MSGTRSPGPATVAARVAFRWFDPPSSGSAGLGVGFGNGIVTERPVYQRDHHASVGVGMVVIQSWLTPARTKNRLQLYRREGWGRAALGNSLCSVHLIQAVLGCAESYRAYRTIG